MSLLVKDLKLSRPERTEFLNSGLGGVQVGGVLKPNREFIPLFSHNVIVARFHALPSVKMHRTKSRFVTGELAWDLLTAARQADDGLLSP
jgi:hypothetical protein